MTHTDRQVFNFNSRVPIGGAVKVRRDNGEILETVTRSEAWVLAGHTPVVLVDGIAGAYLLDRVKPVAEATR